MQSCAHCLAFVYVLDEEISREGIWVGSCSVCRLFQGCMGVYILPGRDVGVVLIAQGLRKREREHIVRHIQVEHIQRGTSVPMRCL